MTVESMLEKSAGTLQDSIWAPHNQAKQAFQQRSIQARQPSRQHSGTAQARQASQQHSLTAQEMASAGQIENSYPSAWGKRRLEQQGTKAIQY